MRNKCNYCLALAGLVLFSNISFAQTNIFPATGSAGIGTTTPNASALLELNSSTQGLLISRMTKGQRDAIVSPATGLMIYQTNSTPGFYYYSGTSWTAVTPKNNNWSLTGNAGTNPSINFIGTTDNQPLLFRLNNTQAGKLDAVNRNYYLGSGAGNSALVTGNIAIGSGALYNNGNGSGCVAVGDSALFNQTTDAGFGYYNTAVGSHALFFTNGAKGFFNVAVGAYALYNNTTSYANTATGYGALYTNIIGFNNTATGHHALYSNSEGNYNTSDGENNLFHNTTGSFNSSNGAFALLLNTTGSSNTASGYGALRSNTTGSFNTAVGDSANVASGNLINATAIGSHALVSASNSLVLGSVSGVNGAASTVNVGIGTSTPAKRLHVRLNGSSGATPNANAGIMLENNGTAYFQLLTPNANENGILFGTASNNANGAIIFNNGGVNGMQLRTGGNQNRIVITSNGKTAIGNFTPVYRLQLNVDSAAKPGTATWTIPSDKRLKKNISPFKDGLKLLNQIDPVWFEYNGDAGLPTGQRYAGVVAQDIQKIAPYMIGTFKQADATGKISEYLDYNPNSLFYILINAVKELAAAKNFMSEKIDELEAQNNALEQRLAKLEAMMHVQLAESGGQSPMNNELSVMSSASLLQNIPNPFNHTTTINYSLPQQYSSAKIIVLDKTGNVLKEINVSSSSLTGGSGKGAGSITVDASTLASGAYNYSLFVDGRLIATKQMVLAK